MMLTPTELGTSLAAGVSLHLFLLRRGDWDLALPQLVTGAAAAPIAVTLGLALLHRHDDDAGETNNGGLWRWWWLWWSAGQTALALVGAALLGLYASMLAYRASPLHRLRRFPGPLAARLSNFYFAARVLGTKQEYRVLKELHDTYGDVVRIGPSSLSINDPRALQLIHGAGSKCTKGPWYIALDPMYSLQTERDSGVHAQRRRVWDRGFSTKSLRNYEPRVSFWGDKLLERVDSKARQGKALDMSMWFNFYSFDVMGDLSLGESFGMLDRGKPHWFMESLHNFMLSLGVFGHIMWAVHIFNKLPVVSSENAKFNSWVSKAVEKRMKNPPDVPDVFSWILDDYSAKARPTAQETINLVGDGLTITVAGSDTTATSLTCLFLELATHPEAVCRLQRELDELFHENPAPDHYALSKLPYLQACVDEALRLYPAVPAGGQRVTPPEGLRIGEDLWIPGNTIVQTPQYILHRGIVLLTPHVCFAAVADMVWWHRFTDERNYGRAAEFIPERWTTETHLNTNGSVFSPFSIGPYNCVGKQLALMEMRNVTSRILHRFDVALAPGQTREAFVGGLVDGFTLSCPKLDLVFTPRE